jgi:hypothetical protein
MNDRRALSRLADCQDLWQRWFSVSSLYPPDENHSIEALKMDPSEDPTSRRLHELEGRLAELETRIDTISQAFSKLRHRSRRIWLRPPLWTFEQYSPKPLSINPRYGGEHIPSDAPSIAIVTPSYNQGNFLRATIESVLEQRYPNLKYHVQDGGSTDDTCNILQSYGPRLSWVSERDTGQTQAINRGFARVGDGDIMAYLNSDDMLLPGTLNYVARKFQERPDVDVFYGHRVFVDRAGLEIGRAVLPGHSNKTLLWADYVPQETLFWRRRVWDVVRPFDEAFSYALDWDFILRAQAAGFTFARLPRFLACFRVHEDQKTAKLYEMGRGEMQVLRCRYLGYEPTQLQINRAVAPYLARQFIFHHLHRWGLLRY